MKETIRQANQYDKILRENIEAVIPSLMKNLLDIVAVVSEELPDDIQHTKERKPDLLKKITDDKGNIFVLQIEFQLSDELEMVYRMAEYKIMLMRLYKIPVKQFVVFLGKAKPKMATQLVTEDLNFKYNLLSISAINYKTFLNSTKPEEIVLSILANFGNETDSKALEQIVKRIEATTKSNLVLEKYFNQLRVLAQLRKLEDKLKDTIMDSIAKFVSIKRDVGYMIGLEQGIEQGIEKTIANLLTKTKHSFEEIADIMGVSTTHVKIINKKNSCR